MEIHIRSTSLTTNITTATGQTPVRLWAGRTSRGARCVLLVATVAVPDTEETGEFEAELSGFPLYPAIVQDPDLIGAALLDCPDVVEQA